MYENILKTNKESGLASHSKLLKKSVTILREKLSAAILAADNGNSAKGLWHFKGLLGPIFPNRTNSNNELNSQDAYQHIRLQCELVITEALQSATPMLGDILRNQKILQARIEGLVKQFQQSQKTKLLDHQEKLKELLGEHDQIANSIGKSGVEVYREWVKKHASLIGNLRGTKYFDDVIKIAADSITVAEKTRVLIANVFDKVTENYAANFAWETIYEKHPELSSRLEAQITVFLGRIKHQIIVDLLQQDTLQEFKQYLVTRKAAAKKAIKKWAVKQPVQAQHKSIESFAKKWFQLITKFPGNEYDDVSVSQLVSAIIAENNISAWELSAEDVAELRAQISQVKDAKVREKYSDLLDLHYGYFAEMSITDIAKKHLELNKISVVASKFDLDTAILLPMSSGKLLSALSHVSCNSEMQFSLKKCLMNCLEQQESLSEDERRKIQYLISCLLLAGAEKTDEGILFSRKPPSVIGISYVLQNSSQSQTPVPLFKGLNNIVSQYDNAKIMFLKSTDAHPLTFTDLILKEKGTPTASKLSQLYWKYSSKQNGNKHSASKVDEMSLAVYYQVRAIQAGNKNLLKRMITAPKKIMAYETERASADELLASLLKKPLDVDSARILFVLYGQRLNTTIYDGPAKRLKEILKALEFLNQSSAKTLSEQEYVKSAVILFVSELAGKNPFQNLLNKDMDKPSETKNYPFRLQSQEKLIAVLEDIFPKGISTITAVLNEINGFVDKNIKKLTAAPQKDKYVLEINAADLLNSAEQMICFINPATKDEIGRFIKENGQVKFVAYGDDISLKINGTLNIPSFIVENPNAKVDLTAEFKSKNLYFSANVNELKFNGNIKTSDTLYCESLNALHISKDSALRCNKIILKPGSLYLDGKIRAVDYCQINADNILEISDLGSCTAKSTLEISANALKNIRGKIIADKISIKTIDSINLRGKAVVEAKSIDIQAKAILSAKKSAVRGSVSLQVVTESNVTLEDECDWKSAKFSINANSFINYSPHTLFGKMFVRLKDKLVNHSTGVINVDESTQINCQSVFNNGVINFGEQLYAAVNEYFVNGLSQFSNADSKTREGKSAIRPSINGGDATIIAGFYVNLLSMLSVGRLSVSSISMLNLAGLTLKTGGGTSSLINLDLGIELPNLPAILKDVQKYTGSIAEGDYQKTLDMTFNKDVFFKASSLLRWLLRTFTSLGQPVDLVWSVLSTIASTPQLLDQCINLYSQEEKIQTYQIVALLNTINSVANQAVMLSGQVESFNGFDTVNSHMHVISPAVALDALALVLPYSSNNSLLTFQSGLHVGFTEVNRNLFNYSMYDVNLAINKTDIFYLSNQENQLLLTNSVALIGESAKNSGVTMANIVYSNVNTQTDSRVIYAEQVNYQNKNVELTDSNKTHANHMNINADNAVLDNQITLGDKADNALTVHTTETTTTASHSQIKASQGSVELRSDGDVNEKGTMSAHTHTVQAGHDFKGEGTIQTETFSEQSGNDTTISNSLTMNHGQMVAHRNMSLAATINVNQNDTESKATTPGLALYSQRLSTDDRNELIAQNTSIITESVDSTSLSGRIDANLLVAHAGNNLADSADLTVTDAELKATGDVKLMGQTHLANSPSSILIVDGQTTELTSSSSTTGNGSVAVRGESGELNNIDVDELFVDFAHVPQVENLLLGDGIYQTVHVHKNIAVTTTDEFKTDRDLDLTISASVTASSIELQNNVHASGSLSFTTTQGNIHVTAVHVAADQALQFDSHGTFIGDKSTVTGYEVAIKALHDVVNNGGQWASSEYLSILSGGDVKINCLSTDVQGKYDTMKSYQPGYLIGGAGAEHGGVGLFVQTDGKFIILGSSVMSEGSNVINAKQGCDLEGLYNRYISYYRHYHNWTGRTSDTTDYSYQLQPAIIYSQNGSNSIISSDGSIYSVSTQFYAAKESNLDAKGDISLLGYVLENREIKVRDNFYIFDKKTDQTSQFAVPTVIESTDNINITSRDGNIEQHNALVQSAADVNESAQSIHIDAPILKTDVVVETSGLTISTPVMDLKNSEPLGQDYQSLTRARGGVEMSVAVSNTLIDSLNFANTILSGINKGAALQGLLQATNLLSVEVGYTHTKTSYHTETAAKNGGVYGNNVQFNAKQDLSVGGAIDVQAVRNLTVNANTFEITGAECHDSVQTGTQSVAVGMSFHGEPTFSASASGAVSHETVNENTHMGAGNNFVVHSNDMSVKNGNVNANNILIQSQTVELESTTGESSSHSWSANASTSGAVGFQNSTMHSSTIGEVTELHADSSITIEADMLTETGAKITSAGTGTMKVGTIVAKEVREEKSGTTVGFSGNVHDLPTGAAQNSQQNIATVPNSPLNIPTVTVALGRQDYDAVQNSVIYFADGGTDLGEAKISGAVDTQDANGLDVKKNVNINIAPKIPLSSVTASVENLKDNFIGAKEAIFDPKAHLGKTTDWQVPEPGEIGYMERREEEVADNTKRIFQILVPNDLRTEDAAQASSDRQKQEEKDASTENVATTDDINSVVIASPNVLLASPPANKYYLNNQSVKETTEAKTNASHPDVYQPDPASLGSYLPPLSDSYSDITKLPSDSIGDVNLGIDDIYKASTESGLPTGFVSGAERFEKGFIEETSLPVQPLKQPDSQSDQVHHEAMEYVDATNRAVAKARDRAVASVAGIAELAWDDVNGTTEILFGLTTEGAHQRNVERGKAIHDDYQEFVNDKTPVTKMITEGFTGLVKDGYNKFVKSDSVAKTEMIVDGIASFIFGGAIAEALGAADLTDFSVSSSATSKALSDAPKMELPDKSIPATKEVAENIALEVEPEIDSIPDPQMLYNDFGYPSLADTSSNETGIVADFNGNLSTHNDPYIVDSWIDTQADSSDDFFAISKTQDAVNRLSDFGLHDAEIREFYEGKIVRIEVPDIASFPIDAYISQKNSIVSLGINYIENTTGGINVLNLWAEQAVWLARALNADKLELYGIDIENSAVARYLRMKGFQKGSNFPIKVFADEDRPTFRKTIDSMPPPALIPRIDLPGMLEEMPSDTDLLEPHRDNISTGDRFSDPEINESKELNNLHEIKRSPLLAKFGLFNSIDIVIVDPADKPFPPGSLSAAKAWSKKGRIKAAQLPAKGLIRFIPPVTWSPLDRLRRGENNGFLDKFGNEWVKGPSRTQGHAFEWDVILSETGKNHFRWALGNATYMDVSLDGRITHGLRRK